jgi:transposase
MKKNKSQHVVFKPYTMGQLQLPANLEDLIPENHVVRVVNETIEKMDLSILMKQYKGGGTSSFHPKMMLKVLIYAYSQRIYSSRQIAKALRENVNFMWISANNRPDFRTINRFRGVVMREIIEEVFASVVTLLIEEGYVKLENYFLDGTKLKANANKYTAVWAKNTGRYKGKLEKKIKELLDDIDRMNEEENEEYGDRDLEELGEGRPIDSEKIEKTMQELNERLRKEPKDKKLSKALRKLEKEYLPKLKKYEEQEQKLGDRNSYSRTDEDATFMRMKGEPPGGKVWPKPGYNIQIGTENQFVMGYSVHQRPGDFCCFIPHLEQVKEQLGELPGNVIADGGYGSEENYDYLEREEVGTYVKYKTFHQEQTRKFKNNPFLIHNLTYDEEKDEFLCPAGKRMLYQETSQEETESGYVIERRHYECEGCQGCELKEQCTRAEGNRRIQISFRLREMTKRARANLHSEEGQRLRSRRGVEVESVFGRLKWNWGFRRFLLRGKEKVELECGLLCIAHNMAKMAT